MLKSTVIALFFSIAAFAHLDSNSVTVTASRSSNLQPDEVVVDVSVTSSTDASLSDVLAAVQAVGITAANFSRVVSANGYHYDGNAVVPDLRLQWSFSLNAPLTRIK